MLGLEAHTWGKAIICLFGSFITSKTEQQKELIFIFTAMPSGLGEFLNVEFVFDSAEWAF